MQVGDLAPEITVLLAAVAVLLVAMFVPQRRHGLCAFLALIGLAVAAAFAVAQFGAYRLTFSGTFALDDATGAARLMILGATALCILLSPDWFAADRRHGEVYAMLLFSALGAMAIGGAADLIQLVMGVLLSSITGYVLAAYHRDWAISVEAGMKYFLVGALTNALMVIGVVLIMGMAGTAAYAGLKGARLSDALALAGLMLVLTGLLFKLGAVPAHPWVPDVAEGAPAPAAAFLTTVPKIAATVALFRLVGLFPPEGALRLLVALIAAATMTLGNLAALWQDDVRRLIGWSSVSQAGYALMAVAVADLAEDALPALLVFVEVYALATIAAFAVVAHLRGRTALADYEGLLRLRPWPVAALIVAFLSLVGIPPLAGFIGKFALFLAVIKGGYAWLAILALANSAVSFFYYARVIAPMVFKADHGPVQVFGLRTKATMLAAAAALIAAPAAAGYIWPALKGTVLP